MSGGCSQTPKKGLYVHGNGSFVERGENHEWTAETSEIDSELESDETSEESTRHHKYDSFSDTTSSTSTSYPNSVSKKERHTRRRIFKKRKDKAIKKALHELRSILEDALQGNNLFGDTHLAILNEEQKQTLKQQNVTDIVLWGVPLLPSKGHEGTDIVLLKFLKAQSYKVNDALEMLKKTLIWRIKEKIDQILEESFDDELDDKVSCTQGEDAKGHPVSYIFYGAFRDKNFYNKFFGGGKNGRDYYLRWRVQLMEKSIKKLEFKEGGVQSMLWISDLKNSPGPGNGMKELGPVSKEAFNTFQQYYPELIYKNIIINTPFWYYIYHGVLTQYCTRRAIKKIVLARPHNVTATLLNYIRPQNIPLQYGGLGRQNDEEFMADDQALEFLVRGGSVATFKVPVSEGSVTIVWEVMVVGWDVTYKDEFVPDDEGSYRILLFSEKKITESVRNSFYVNEPGIILITIKNISYVKKRVFIRRKSKLTLPVYMTTCDHNINHNNNVN